VPADSKTLTPEQVRSFEADGYLVGPVVGDAAEIDARRAYFRSLIAQMQADDPDREPYALMGYHTRCAGLWDLVHDPRILDLVQALIGPDIVCWSTQLFDKQAADTRQISLHQDAAYWQLEPAATVSCWLAIDASTVENGCLHVVPGSHRFGEVPWEETTAPHPLAGTVEAFVQSVVDAPQYGEPVAVELAPGQVSFHSDLTIHGSGPNPSGKRRAGFAIRYCPPSVRPTHTNWGRNAVLCRGEDRFQHFGYVAQRPEGEDTRTWAAYLMDQRRAQRRKRRGTKR